MGEVTIRMSGGVPANFLHDAMTSQTFADVALCCSGGQRFLAHRLVLSAASPYLHKVLLAHGSITGHCELITVILAEVEGNDLAAILGFLYTGTVAVPKARLEAFSSTADALRIAIPPLPHSLTQPSITNDESSSKYHYYQQSSSDKIPMDLTTRALNHERNLMVAERMECLRQLLAPPIIEEKSFNDSYNSQMYLSTMSTYARNNIIDSQENCINLTTPSNYLRENNVKLKSIVANRVGASPWTQLVRVWDSPKVQQSIAVGNNQQVDIPIESFSTDTEHYLSLTHDQQQPTTPLNLLTVGVRRISSPLNHDPIDRTSVNAAHMINSCISLESDKIADINDNHGTMINNSVTSLNIPASVMEDKYITHVNTIDTSLNDKIEENLSKINDNKKTNIDTGEPIEFNDNNNNNNNNNNKVCIEVEQLKEDQHNCEICGKTFVSRTSLKIHGRIHTGAKPFRCEDCGKEFSQLRNYKYHRSVHEGTGEFAGTCSECGKCFNDRNYLGSHIKIHRNKKEYVCEECGKSFNQRVAYNMHVRIHSGVKPHRCEECGKSFSRKMLLKQHLRTHSGERPYQCSICNKAFADRSNMTLHTRLHSGLKPYQCDICCKKFSKRHHLQSHMNYHTGTKPYSCPNAPNCTRQFSQSSNMRSHYKKCLMINKPRMDFNSEMTSSVMNHHNNSDEVSGFSTALTPPHSDFESHTVVHRENSS